MKGRVSAAVLLALIAGTASAGEQGTINQAGPYEATMQFYLHPAHGFPGKPEAAPAAAQAETIDGKAKADARPAESRQNVARARARKAG